MINNATANTKSNYHPTSSTINSSEINFINNSNGTSKNHVNSQNGVLNNSTNLINNCNRNISNNNSVDAVSNDNQANSSQMIIDSVSDCTTTNNYTNNEEIVRLNKNGFSNSNENGLTVDGESNLYKNHSNFNSINSNQEEMGTQFEKMK